jgi:hypothetical protein
LRLLLSSLLLCYHSYGKSYGGDTYVEPGIKDYPTPASSADKDTYSKEYGDKSVAEKHDWQTDEDIKYTKLFIDNIFTDAINGGTFKTIDPRTGEVLCEVSAADTDDVNRAVEAAKRAFKLGSEWRTMDASDRGTLLYRLADLIERDRWRVSNTYCFYWLVLNGENNTTKLCCYCGCCHGI